MTQRDTNTDNQPQPTINWRAIRDSLRWDEAEQHRHLLRQRAEQYAAPPRRAQETPADALTVLTFTLGDERYGVDVALVQAVRVLPPVTPVPGTPDFYHGVVNVRGQIITVLDLRRFFGQAVDAEALRQPRELVIVRSAPLALGLLVQEVIGVATVPSEALCPFEQLRYARGVTAERLVLLDLTRLFEDDRLIVRDADE